MSKNSLSLGKNNARYQNLHSATTRSPVSASAQDTYSDSEQEVEWEKDGFRETSFIDHHTDSDDQHLADDTETLLHRIPGIYDLVL